MGQKWPVSRRSISSLNFLSYRSVTFLFANLKTRTKNSRDQNFEFWCGAGHKMLGSEWVGGYTLNFLFFGGGGTLAF